MPNVQLGQRQQRRVVNGVVVVGRPDEGERDNTRLKAAELREYLFGLTGQQCAFLVELVQALAVLTFDDIQYPVLLACQVGELILPALILVFLAKHDHHDAIHRTNALGAPVDDVLCRVVGQHRVQQPCVLLGHGGGLHVRRVHQQPTTAYRVNFAEGVLGLLPQTDPGAVRILQQVLQLGWDGLLGFLAHHCADHAGEGALGEVVADSPVLVLLLALGAILEVWLVLADVAQIAYKVARDGMAHLLPCVESLGEIAVAGLHPCPIVYVCCHKSSL